MANPCLLHLPLRDGLDGRDRNGVVTATASGPVRFTADGYYAEEGTTNIEPNPRFDANIAGWSSYVGGTPEWDGTVANGDGRSLRHTRSAGAGNEGVLRGGGNRLAVSASLPYTLSFEARTDQSTSVTINLVLVWRDSGGTSVGASDSSSFSLTSSDGWKPNVRTAASPVGAVSVEIRIYTGSGAVGERFWLSKMQLEQKAYATSFCHGSLGTGYSWAGTAHNSASSRAETRVSLDEAGRISAQSGAIALRFKRLIDTGNSEYLMAVGQTSVVVGTDFIGLRVGSDDKLQLLTIKDGGNQAFAVPTGTAPLNTALAAYADWSGTAIRSSLNWQAVATSVRVAPHNNLDTSNQLAFGQLYSGALRLDGSISDVLIFDRPLTDAERATLAAMDAWSFDTLRDDRQSRRSLSMGLSF